MGHVGDCEFCRDNHDRYTRGQCWLLAFALSQRGFPVYTLGPAQSEWWHVVAQVGSDKYLDIQGLHTEDGLCREWPDPMSEEPGPYQGQLYEVESFTDFADYCEVMEHRYVPRGESTLAGDLANAETVADHLIRAYVAPPCLAVSRAGTRRVSDSRKPVRR